MRPRSVLPAIVLAVVSLPSVSTSQENLTVPERVRFTSGPGEVADAGPHGAFRGTIEVRRTPQGLTVVNELDVEEYLLGIREVPRMWPMEVLKAQAVAARTYALWHRQRGTRAAEGFDICATVACQVYAGATGEDGGEPDRRWAEAVRDTQGRVLLHQGRPALTRYHSSSGGRTLPNHVAFPGSHALPYLTGVDDPDDSISPLHTWSVAFAHEALESILRTELGFEGPMVGFSTDQGSGVATVSTEEGALTIQLGRLRTVVNELAPAMFPDRYPGPRDDGQPMPAALPSARFDVEAAEDGYLLHGRGYGHGVGMSQWGAMGRASRGESYVQILAAYYGGLTPQAWTSDRALRVGVVEQASEIRVSGTLGVDDGAAPLWTPVEGEWLVRPGGDGELVVVGPPLPTPVPEPSPEPVVASPHQAALPARVRSATPERGRDLSLVALAFVLLAAAATAAGRRNGRA